MLFKRLISTYGSSLHGKSRPEDDPVWHLGQSEELRSFRQYAVEALQKARVYLLDHAAAAYTDTFHESMLSVGDPDNVTAIQAFVSEVELPSDVIWVEYDFSAVTVSRFDRNGAEKPRTDIGSGFGERGFLIDNRHPQYLRAAMFRSDTHGRILDPFGYLRFQRNAEGKPALDGFYPEPNAYMLDKLLARGVSQEMVRATYDGHMSESSYDLFIPYALFAMLASPDLGGIVATDSEIFTQKEAKTARKFGRVWITGAPRSHLTVRIGPQAVAHMRERFARLEHERHHIEARNGPIQHWVVEHERHYKGGKLVVIKGHHRGKRPDPALPTRVMGPRVVKTGAMPADFNEHAAVAIPSES